MKINPDKILDIWGKELISENQKVTMNIEVKVKQMKVCSVEGCDRKYYVKDY